MENMETESQPVTVQLVNWELAAGTAAKLAPAGPSLSKREIADVVASLREAAETSVEHVYRITGLEAARDLRDSRVLVVDRASWAKANSQSFQALLQPTLEKLAKSKSEQLQNTLAEVGGTVTGAQFGAILAFLSSKVLGQYDPFASLGDAAAPPSAGRLLLVAPNVVSIERELNVDPADFRLWVCLHEQTHRVQFAAAPWLRDHMVDQISQLSGGLMDKADTLQDRLGQLVKNLGAERGKEVEGVPSQPAGLMSLLQDPEDQARMSHLTAVMSLLEGHANVVMDAVDSSIVPSVKTIRQRFNARGKTRNPLDKLIRRFMGLDAKMRQYSDGARFVRAIVREVGMEGFNRVWEREENLPTEKEIHTPKLWLERMALDAG